MQHITNLAALDRELAGRVARFQAVTDTQFEPWHQPHFSLQHDSAPAPAEAATDGGVDQDTIPKPPMGYGAAFWFAWALLLVLLGVHGWFAGWFA